MAQPKHLQTNDFASEDLYVDYANVPADDPSRFAKQIMRSSNACAGTGAKSTSHRGRSSPCTFPTQLHGILSRPDLSHIISWMPHGRSWKVFRPQDFITKVSPHFFSHKKYSSFIRLAHCWGFRRINEGLDSGSYYHELFLRGQPQLLVYMSRQTPLLKKVTACPDNAPDFYKMAFLPQNFIVPSVPSPTTNSKTAKYRNWHDSGGKAEVELQRQKFQSTKNENSGPFATAATPVAHKIGGKLPLIFSGSSTVSPDKEQSPVSSDLDAALKKVPEGHLKVYNTTQQPASFSSSSLARDTSRDVSEGLQKSTPETNQQLLFSPQTTSTAVFPMNSAQLLSTVKPEDQPKVESYCGAPAEIPKDTFPLQLQTATQQFLSRTSIILDNFGQRFNHAIQDNIRMMSQQVFASNSNTNSSQDRVKKGLPTESPASPNECKENGGWDDLSRQLRHMEQSSFGSDDSSDWSERTDLLLDSTRHREEKRNGCETAMKRTENGIQPAPVTAGAGMAMGTFMSRGKNENDTQRTSTASVSSGGKRSYPGDANIHDGRWKRRGEGKTS